MLSTQVFPSKSVGDYESLTISLYAEGIQIGEARNKNLCPYCHGGGSKEKSFSLKGEVYGVVWRCWRASCSKHGRLDPKTGMFHDGAPAFDDREYSPPRRGVPANFLQFMPLHDFWRDKLLYDYGILPEQAIAKDWKSNKQGMLVIPMRSCRGAMVGYEFRGQAGEPKSMIEPFSNSSAWVGRNAIDTHHIENKRIVMIVEDNISALKASLVCKTYCIQGTNFTHHHALELENDWRATLYLLALDKDATNKSVEYFQRFKFLLPNLKLCPLERDIKNYTVAQIQQLVESYKNELGKD